MSGPPPSQIEPLPSLAAIGTDAGLKRCCAAVYGHPAVRWLLGDELHPGGEAATLRALDLAGIGSGHRLLDVASGSGASALAAARELGCEVVGIEYGAGAVDQANATAIAAGVGDRVRFEVGDAEALPFEDESFDAVLCECSLCTFADKPRAVEQLRRVLRPGGRLVLCDVVVDRSRVPAELSGPLAVLACVGEALSSAGYERLLAAAGLSVIAVEHNGEDAAALARRVHERLRGARLLGVERMAGAPLSTSDAIGLIASARRAIDDGGIGYSTFVARRSAPAGSP